MAMLLASAVLPLCGTVAWSQATPAHKTEKQQTAKEALAKTQAKSSAAKPKPQAKAPEKFETAAGHKATERVGIDVAALTPLSKSSEWNEAFPALLSESDAARYRVIFQLQENADFKGADDIIAKLRDRGLMGHVLAQRFLHPQYRVTYQELSNWLVDYDDHPDARRLYELAVQRKPKNAKNPRVPSVPDIPAVHTTGINVQAYDRQAFESKTYVAQKKLSAAEKKEYDKLIEKLDWTLRKGTQANFRKLLVEDKSRALLHPVEYDRQSGRLAQGYYAVGQDDQAFFWGEQATKRSGQYLPEIHWTTGLAAWRMGKLEDAARHFEAVTKSEYASRWLIAAGAFWSGRAHIRMRHHQDYTRMMELAGQSPRTFYGLLARRLLNKDAAFNWAPPPLDKAALKELGEAPGGKRAVMLLQIGSEVRAERELRALTGKTSKGLAEAMLALAERAQMPSLAMRLGNMLVKNGSPISDATAYPAPQMTPAAGELVDRELILALVRQESGFNPNALSPAGARGLMQLMPDTATFIARDAKMSAGQQHRLYEPEVNLMLGQRYIDILMKDGAISGDLFRMVTAWNAGPGNLGKWMKSVKHNDDPLLFIESVPSPETRNFVERVLTNYWVYRQRFNQPINSLDSVAGGKWPVYLADKSDTVEVAEDGRSKK
jgi:soluble lytic murein transglycosylase